MVSFTNDERDGVVVRIDKLEQFLLQKGANNITDAFKLIFQTIEGINHRVQMMDNATAANRVALNAKTPVSVADGLLTADLVTVSGFLPARTSALYQAEPNFEEKYNRILDSARQITEDIFGEPS